MPKPLLPGVAWLMSSFGLAACGASNTAPDPIDASRLDAATNRAATLAVTCSGCHSANGDVVVSLDGYGAEALRSALITYRSEVDGVTVMHRLARGYSDDDIAHLSEHFEDMDE